MHYVTRFCACMTSCFPVMGPMATRRARSSPCCVVVVESTASAKARRAHRAWSSLRYKCISHVTNYRLNSNLKPAAFIDRSVTHCGRNCEQNRLHPINMQKLHYKSHTVSTIEAIQPLISSLYYRFDSANNATL